MLKLLTRLAVKVAPKRRAPPWQLGLRPSVDVRHHIRRFGDVVEPALHEAHPSRPLVPADASAAAEEEAHADRDRRELGEGRWEG